jgi:hypothetical protein
MKAHIRLACVLVAALHILLQGTISCESKGTSLTELVPATGEIEGWQRDGEYLIFYPENLWEYIDGAAEGFLAYEFEQVIAQDYLSESGKGLKVEIYDHGTPLMAFGIYAQHRDPDLTFCDIGNEGFGDPFSLHFWKGRYYVKIIVFEESNELIAHMKTFADAIASKVTDTGTLPATISCFPKEGLVEKSIMYITEGVLGRGKFPPAFVASYGIGEGEGKFYLFSIKDEEASERVFDWYVKEVGTSGSTHETEGQVYIGARGNDPYMGEVLVFRYGRWMGILTAFGDSKEIADALAEGAVKRLALQPSASP